MIAACDNGSSSTSSEATQPTNTTNTSDTGITNATHEHTYVEHTAVAATCDTDGSIKYFTCSGCDKIFDENKNEISQSAIKVNKLNHEFGTTTYVWNGDKCTATRVCSRNSSHIETETVTGVYTKVTDATCGANERGKYVATFTNTAFTVQESEIFDKPNTAINHNYGTPTYVWNGNECTATRTCSNDSTHVETETVTGVYTKVNDATCEANETGKYTVTFTNQAFTAQESEVFEKENTKLGHDYGTPTYVWDGNKCTATRICGRDQNHIETETVTGVYTKVTDATCDANERGKYVATFTNTAFTVQESEIFDKPNTAINHNYGAPTYVWNGDKCTATRVCANDTTHTETETVTGVYTKVSDATCGANERGKYVATFTNTAFTVQESEIFDKPNTAINHSYGTSTYVWNGDECTATRVCANNPTHVETETVTGTYVKVTDATCEANETGKYTVTFTNQAFAAQESEVFEKTDSKLGHSYGTPTYVWNGDKCTATRICGRDQNHIETETVTGVYTKVTDATCTSNEIGKYVATFTNQAFKTQSSETFEKENTMLEHEYEFFMFVWNSDNTKATAVYKCTVDEGVTKEYEATITTSSTKATCTENGSNNITATHGTNTETKSTVIPATGHNWNGTICDGRTCAKCNTVETAKGHDYELISSTKATCENAKINYYECKECGHKHEATEGEPLGHNIKDVTPVEVQVEGSECEYILTYRCTECNAIIEGEKVEHHHYEAVITTPATCVNPGEKTYTCSKCNDSYTEEIPADTTLGHSWQIGEVLEGIRTDVCEHCHEERKVIVTDGNKSANTDANNLKGTEVEVNNANLKLDDDLVDELAAEGKSVSLSVDTIDENVKEDLLSPDQLAQIGDNPVYDFSMTDADDQRISTFGNNYITITLPYTLKEGDDIDNIAVWFINDSGELEMIMAAYNNGYVTFKTNHFSYYVVTLLTPQERCALYGHSWAIQHVDGDCTHDTYDLYVCKRCHEREVKNLVPATGHKYELDTEHSHDATCTEDGVKKYVCSECGNSYTEITISNGHKYSVKEVVDPTCDTVGYTIYECSECHNTYTSDYTAAIPHEIKWTFDDEDPTYALCEICCDFYTDHNKSAKATYKTLVSTATCIQTGDTTYVYTAVIDGITYTTTKVATGILGDHNISTEYSYDKDCHYHECIICHAHFDEEGHELDGDTCTICGYEVIDCNHESNGILKPLVIDGVTLYYTECDCGESRYFESKEMEKLSPKMTKSEQIDSETMYQEGTLGTDYSVGLIMKYKKDGCFNIYDGTIEFFYKNESLGTYLFHVEYESHSGNQTKNVFDLTEYGVQGFVSYYECPDCHKPIRLDMQNGMPFSFEDAVMQLMSSFGQDGGELEYTNTDKNIYYYISGYKMVDHCYYYQVIEVLIKVNGQTVFEIVSQEYMGSDHEYEIIDLPDDFDCEIGATITEVCKKCGSRSTYTVRDHQFINKPFDLSLVGGKGTIEISECKYCHYCSIENSNSLMKFINEQFAEPANEEVIINGVSHTIQTTSKAKDYDLYIVIDSYFDAVNECVKDYYYVFKFYKYSTNELVLEKTFRQRQNQHNFKDTYEFATDIHNCEEGIKVISHCDKCGTTHETVVYGHKDGFIERKIDLSEYGGIGYIYIQSCLCGEYIHVNDKIYDNPRKTSYIDDNGFKHIVETYTDGNILKTVDTYDEYISDDSCRYYRHEHTTYTSGNVLIYEFSETYDGMQHDYSYKYEFLTDDHDCESGVRVTAICNRCGEKHDEIYDRHVSLPYYIDLSEYGDCEGTLMYSICPCGKTGYFNENNVTSDCVFTSEYVNSIIDEIDDPLFYVLDFACEYRCQNSEHINGFRYMRVEYLQKPVNCLSQRYFVLLYGYDNTTNKYTKAIKYNIGTTYRHNYETTYSETMEDGYRVQISHRECSCGAVEEDKYYYDSNNNEVKYYHLFDDKVNTRDTYTHEYTYYSELDVNLPTKDISIYYEYKNGSTSSTTKIYTYDFDKCERLITYIYDGGGKTETSEAREEYHAKTKWIGIDSCTQNDYRICAICGKNIEDGYHSKYGHDYEYDEENDEYYCTRCGLISKTGVDGEILLENLTGRLSDYDDYFLVGYYNPYNIEIAYTLELVVDDNDPELLDVEFGQVENFNIIMISREQVVTCCSEILEGLEPNKVQLLFTIVPTSSQSNYNYSISLN